jgi:hypothetical protein
MDWEMWLRMAARYPIGYLAVRDNGARIHGESLSAASKRWGDMHLRIIRRADELIATEQPDLVLPAGLRERRMIYAYLKSGLDALEEGDVAQARGFLRAARKLDASATALDPKGVALVAGLLGGSPARRAVRRARHLESRLQLRYKLAGLGMSANEVTAAIRGYFH